MKTTSDMPCAAQSPTPDLLRTVGRRLRAAFVVRGPDVCRIARNGLFRQNPVFVFLLGLCPVLATTTSLFNGLGMGLATTAVLICSDLVISLLRRIIPRGVRIVCHAVIIAAFASAADLLMQAYMPELSEALGLYVPLIAVNGILLGRAEAFACQNPPDKALLDGLFTGLGFTGALALLGAVRELLGSGTIWGHPIPVLNEYPVGLIAAPCGGFLALGVLLALIQFLCRPKKGGGKA